MFVFTSVLHRMDLGLHQNLIFYGFEIQKHLVNLLFALILYYDCSKEKHGSILIPLLGFFQPGIGAIFYFISTFILHPQKIES